MKKIILLLTILVQVSVAFSQHFEKGFVGSGTDQMNIYINSATIAGIGALEAGDEIAVFDGNLCVGAITLTQPLNPLDYETQVGLKASADDGSDNGYIQGHTMYFRVYDSSTGIEYHNVIPTITDRDGNPISNQFVTSGTAFVSLSTGNTTKTWTNSNENRVWNSAENWEPLGIPEPFNDVIIPADVESTPLIGTTENVFCGDLVLDNLTAMILNSSSAGTGSLIVTSDITGAGVVTSRRYLLANGWHMVSSPISGQSIAGFLSANSTIPTKPDGSKGMMEYEEINDDWSNFYSSSTAGDLSMGKGYSVRRQSAGTVVFTGTLNNGDVAAPVTKDNFGWNLVGNPFPSAMYVRQEVFGFLVENAGMLDASFKAIYLWDPAANGGLGAYSIVNKNEGEANLASGQGFFIKAASAGNVNFTKQMQVHQTNALFKSGTISRPSVVLNAKTGNISSSTKISFDEEMTLGLDPGYDAGILRSGHGFDIYSRLVTDNGVDFAIQALPGFANDSYIIPIGVDATKGGEVVFSAQALDLPVGYDVIIEDKLTKSQTNVKDGGLYVANLADGAKGVGRFYLHVGASVQTGLDEVQKQDVVVYTVDQTVFIKGSVSDNAMINVYSVDGRLVNRFTAISQNLNKVSVSGYSPGVYILKIQDKNNYKPLKFVVE
ncbi:hypothetical protein MASR2M47_45920 [Draconibacterium sp.]